MNCMIYKTRNIFGKIKNKNFEVTLTGSKSVTARALVCAALAKGKSVLHGASVCDDSSTIISCLKALGIGISVSGANIFVEGCGGKIPEKKASFNVGNSGTAARFLTALAAFSDGEYYIDCSDAMKKRPILPLLDYLRAAGAFIEAENGGFPLKIRGTSPVFPNIKVDITESSQFLSALFLTAVCAQKPVKISFSGSHSLNYADMTSEVMRAFGAEVFKDGNTYCVNGVYKAADYKIEPDISSACYFYAANKILETEITVKDMPLKSLQCDFKFIDFLKSFNGGKADMSAFSDQTLTLAAIAPYLDKTTEIYGVGHIRKQECDRLNAIRINLSAMGVECEEFADGIKIYPAVPKPAKLKTFGDHRVAMAFALTGLRADGIEIENAEVVSKTFPDYFGVLDGLCASLTK